MTWTTLTLEQVAEGGLFSDGDWVESKDQDPTGSVRLTQLADVGVGEFRDRSNRWLREDQAERLHCTFLQPDDVLIARMPDPIGRACLVPQNAGRAVTAVDVAILRIGRPDILPKFVMWAINTPDFNGRVQALQSGTTRKRISRKNLAKLTVDIPPLEEQQRIVAILDDHLSRLDAAEALLESGHQRIRAVVWGALSRIRDGESTELGNVAEIQGGIQKQQRRTPRSNAYPFLRVANVTDKGLDLSEVHKIELFGDELSRLRLSAGDLLVVEGNGSPSQIGRAAIWDGSIADCVHQNHLIRVRPSEKLLPEYLEAIWNSRENREALTHLSSSSSGLHTLSVAKLKRIQVPVPSLAEQQSAVRFVSQVRDDCRRLELALGLALQRSVNLRRSLLSAAFSGELTLGHEITEGVA